MTTQQLLISTRFGRVDAVYSAEVFVLRQARRLSRWTCADEMQRQGLRTGAAAAGNSADGREDRENENDNGERSTAKCHGNREGGNRAFGGGRVVRQYMSGVGVITERHVPDDDLFFYESSDRFSVASGSDGLFTYRALQDTGEDCKEPSAFATHCPCAEKAYEARGANSGLFANVFSWLRRRRRDRNNKYEPLTRFV